MIFLLAILSHLPILTQYASRMWRSGHYQFFPVLLLALAWLFSEQKNYIFSQNEKPNNAVGANLLIINLMLVGIATILNSSFLGALSAWMLAAIFFYSRGGTSSLIRGMSLLIALLFIIPMPARLDEQLILKLQYFASQLASQVLDNLGIVHFVEGVVLITEKKQFMTEEACSGIRSLFSSLAGIALYSAMFRLSWWRSLFNFVQVVFWVLVSNAIRIATVVYVSDTWTDVLATGIGHTVFGLVMFGFVLAMSISTDRLINAILARAEVEEEDYSPVDLENEANVETVSKEEQVFTSFGLPVWFSVPLALSFILVAILGVRLLWLQSSQNEGIWITSLPRLSFPKKEDLPEQVGSWNLTEFEWKSRGANKLQAEDSFVWTYESPEGIEFNFSLDCPWDKWHNLADCYSGLGWGTSMTYHDASEFGWVWSKIELQKLGREAGVVFFRSVDRHGHEVTPQFSGGFFNVRSIANQVNDNFSAILGFDSGQNANINGISLPATTLQLICVPDSSLSESQIAELQSLFVEISSAITKSNRFVEFSAK